MKTITKIGIGLAVTVAGLAALYLLLPLKAWKKYKEEHPALFEVQDEATPTYISFVNSYWKTFSQTGTPKEEEMTYDGGQLPDIDITAKFRGPETPLYAER